MTEIQNYGKLLLTKKIVLGITFGRGAVRLGCGKSPLDCPFRQGSECTLTPYERRIYNNFVVDDRGDALPGFRPKKIQCGGEVVEQNGNGSNEDPLLRLLEMIRISTRILTPIDIV